VDAPQHTLRVDLVVERVEHEHDVERLLDGEPSHVEHLEADIGELGATRLGPSPGDRSPIEVVPGELRRGERSGQQHERMTGAARDVGGSGARGQLLGEAGRERKVRVDEELIERAPPDGVHDVGELGAEFGVGHAATLAKRAGDLVHVLGEHRVRLRDRRHARVARQQQGMLGRQHEGLRRGVEVDDATGDHRPQPLADVALGEPVAR
jgi:hypothetical protein